MFEGMLSGLHVPLRRVADEGLGVVPEVLPEDVQKTVRPAVGDGLYAIMMGWLCTVHTFWTMGGMSPASCFTALASSSSSRDGMAGLPARRRRAATLFGLPAGAFCLESRTKGPVDIGGRLAGIPVGAVRVPLPGQPCPPNPSSFARQPQLPVPHSREGGASARRRICPTGRDAQKWRRN